MYTRGYVEKTVDNLDDIPMCGCIESHSPVSRADCTQVDVTLSFVYNLDANGHFVVEVGEDMNVAFNECEGINAGTGTRKNNDLSAHVNKLVIDGKMTNDMQKNVYDILVGFENPNQNSNEPACKKDYEDVTQKSYPCIKLEDVAVNGCSFEAFYEAIDKIVSRVRDCPHDTKREIQIFTGTSNDAAAKSFIDDKCKTAWGTVDTSSFTSVDSRFTDEFMAEYVDGFTFLNSKFWFVYLVCIIMLLLCM
jgi:polyhydroxyalkanoate synthesis regulator phasin